MADYCFASEEGRYALFAEAAMRGFVAAIRDFPHLKDCKEGTVEAWAECDVLRPSVCCVPSDAQEVYRRLVSSAWLSYYLARDRLMTSRESVVMASCLKGRLIEEAWAIARPAFEDPVIQTELGEEYARFVALT